MKKFLTYFIALLTPVLAGAQSIPVNPKFGAVSKEEVEMETYARDTSAAIMLLYTCRSVEVGINMGGLYRNLLVHDRWKVLKEAGKDQVDYEIFHSYSNDYLENVRKINVVTYNLEDGKVKSQKMSKEYLFDEKHTDGVKRLTFAPENVKVGSVVEVTYLIESPTIQIGTVELQKSVPVNLSEAKISYGEFISYNVTSRGFTSFDREQETNQRSLGADYSYTEYTDIYRAVDIPAVKKEPYCFCPRFYRTAISYDVRSIYIMGVINKDYSRTWEDVDEQMVSTGLIDCCKAPFKEAKSLAASLSGLPDEVSRIAAVRNFVMDKVTWNEKVARFPAKGKSVAKDGTGDSADINALVASALNTLGYKAEPVLVKLRSSGPMANFMISVNTYDAMILRIACPNGEIHYLDAARKDAFVDILDPDYLVSQARLISLEKQGAWVDLTQIRAANVINETVQMRFNEEGVLSGMARVMASGLDSYNIRSHYHSFANEEEWIEDTEKDEGIRVKEMHLDQPDEYLGTSTVNYSFETDQTLGQDYLYINLFLSKFHPETAFRSEERTLPVEFPYPNQITYRISIYIPEGYEVESLPESVVYTCTALDNTEMMLRCMQQGMVVNLIYKMTLGNVLVPDYGYKDLRLFWEQLCRIEKSVLVLKKV